MKYLEFLNVADIIGEINKPEYMRYEVYYAENYMGKYDKFIPIKGVAHFTKGYKCGAFDAVIPGIKYEKYSPITVSELLAGLMRLDALYNLRVVSQEDTDFNPMISYIAVDDTLKRVYLVMGMYRDYYVTQYKGDCMRIRHVVQKDGTGTVYVVLDSKTENGYWRYNEFDYDLDGNFLRYSGSLMCYDDNDIECFSQFIKDNPEKFKRRMSV